MLSQSVGSNQVFRSSSGQLQPQIAKSHSFHLVLDAKSIGNGVFGGGEKAPLQIMLKIQAGSKALKCL